jgi:hypothetical protein
LEQARTYVNGSLYGLTEEVFGLQHSRHIWQFGNYMRLEYLSPRYEQYRYKFDRSFVITTYLFGENERPVFGVITYAIEAGVVLFTTTRMIGGDALMNRLPDQDRSQYLTAKDATFTIDGKSFKGDITHYTAPVRYSSFTLYHGRIGLKGEALGPSLEELIQIVESLRDLNGKAGE